jgi:FkbM family methyltransferase
MSSGRFPKGIVNLVRRIRPAPLASAIANLSGLSRRQPVRTAHGSFLVNAVSNLGYQLMFGDYEPSMRAVLQRYLKPGDVFIDLGANEGYFSVLASGLVGPGGTVIAVEPQSRLQSVIRANLTLNHCSNVRVLQAVVSSTTDPVEIELASEMNTGGSSLFSRTKYPLKRELVPSFTIAAFLEQTGVERCDLMKVDVEGAEYDVFIGAGEILKSGLLRNIALEIHGDILERRGLSGAELHEWILSCGYQLNDELGNWVYTSSRSDVSPVRLSPVRRGSESTI